MTRAVVGLVFAIALNAQGPVPRPAGALTIGGSDVLTQTQALHRPTVLALVSSTCPHCAAVARVMQTASVEFPDVNFIAVTSDEGADTLAWSHKAGVMFNAFYAPRAEVLRFLGLPDRALGTPQMVFIDRKGVIRAQSERRGSPQLQSPDYMRELIKALVAEGK
jgi:hypothetical protein